LVSQLTQDNKSLISLLLASSLFLPLLLSAPAYASNGDEEWRTAYKVGKFLNSEPPKSDQIFKIQYRAVNGTIESLGVPDEVAAIVTSDGNGTLQIRYPRNYPYTNDIDGGGDPVVIINEIDVIASQDMTDCFFVFSIPFTGSSRIVLAWAYQAVEQPRHGDVIPDSCISQTVVESVPVRQDGTISPLHQVRAGVAAEDVACKEGLELVINPNGKPYCAQPSTAIVLRERWNLPLEG
jgi:hypothetical protein